MSNPHSSSPASVAASDDYFQFDEEKEDFMMRFVDGTCQGWNPDNQCGMLPACGQSIENQLDILTHCRQPLGFLSFFREQRSPEGDVVGVEIMPAGVYVVPTFCEYCNVESTKLCADTCTRPKLFFQKKRPMFCRPDATRWDPVTDYARENVEEDILSRIDDGKRSPSVTSWAGLFSKEHI